VRSVEDTRPRRGLSVPVVTVLDRSGDLCEDDQRRLVRFVIQDGDGADVIFAAGTTGEWDRLPPSLLRRVVRVSVEEVAKANAGRGERERVEVWAGVTAHTAAETLASLEAAIAAGADAAVLAPLSIRGLADPVAFVAREIADLLDASARRIPVYLYDNADIAADPAVPHIRTRQVKALSRLDFVRGIKVSAPLKVLGNYTRAAAGFRERGEFGIYVGNAHLIFEIFRPRHGVLGVLAEHWMRRRMRGGLPVGVVAGPANALPREWARAWQVCRAGDGERMQRVERVLAAFRDAVHGPGGRRSVACLKRALLRLGVVASDAVAEGTAALSPEQASAFDAGFDAARQLAREELPASWLSRAPEARA
jgi:dihydrodipicolinate synthase/N-acetylneuraminate lyase